MKNENPEPGNPLNPKAEQQQSVLIPWSSNHDNESPENPKKDPLFPCLSHFHSAFLLRPAAASASPRRPHHLRGLRLRLRQLPLCPRHGPWAQVRAHVGRQVPGPRGPDGVRRRGPEGETAAEGGGRREEEKGSSQGFARSCGGKRGGRGGSRRRERYSEGGRAKVVVRGNHWRPQRWQVCAN